MKALRYLFIFFLQTCYAFAFAQKQHIKLAHLDINVKISGTNPEGNSNKNQINLSIKFLKALALIHLVIM